MHASAALLEFQEAAQGSLGPESKPPSEQPAGGDAGELINYLQRQFEELANLGELPWWLESLVILLMAFVVAVVTRFLLCRVLRRLALRTRLSIDDSLIDLMRRPLFASIVVLGFALALKPMGLEAKAIDQSLLTLAILIWAPFAFKASSLLLRAASDDEGIFKAVEPRTFPLFDNLTKVLLFSGLTYIIFSRIWSIDPAGFLVSAGIAGIAIGFAAQDTLSNLFAGVFIIADTPYAVGDFIHLDSGERGLVLHIGLRSTRILTRDDIQITIPNAVMGQAKITNESGGPTPKHRIRVAVSCAYGSDIDQVREILVEVAKANAHVCSDPEPRVRFRNFGDSGLNFELCCWLDEPVLRGRVMDALNSNIYKRFAAESIEIPYPKQDVYMHQVPPKSEAEQA